MGHDISAYKIKNKKPSQEEIAYLRFAAWNITGQKLFYGSLEANEFNHGCSGNGDEKTFSIERIKIAKSKLQYEATDNEILDIINADSNTEKHNFFKSVVSMLSGQETKLQEATDETLKYELEKIHEFYGKIIASKVKKVVIWFG